MEFKTKICFPIQPVHQGGGFYFIRLFQDFLTHSGVSWTDDIQDQFDILFLNSWQVPYRAVRRVKIERPSVRVIHRVDGAAQDYGRQDNADFKQACVNMLADATIFQSDYCKTSTRERFKVVRKDGPVIHNPVDIDMFSLTGERLTIQGDVRVCNAAWSTNKMKGTWRIPQLARDNPDITFVLCGRYPEIPHLPNVCYLGHLDYSELARAMRSCDVFLDLSENECCPNVVLQALASGLPVLHKGSGGVPELVEDAGITLQADISDFRAAVEHAMKCRETLSDTSRKRTVNFFAPSVIFPRYLSVMENAIRGRLPATSSVLQAGLRAGPFLTRFSWKSPVQKIRKLMGEADKEE